MELAMPPRSVSQDLDAMHATVNQNTQPIANECNHWNFQYFRFYFELNIELNHVQVPFSIWMNNQNYRTGLILNPQSPILIRKSSILNPKSSFLNPQSSILNSHPQKLGFQWSRESVSVLITAGTAGRDQDQKLNMIPGTHRAGGHNSQHHHHQFIFNICNDKGRGGILWDMMTIDVNFWHPMTNDGLSWPLITNNWMWQLVQRDDKKQPEVTIDGNSGDNKWDNLWAGSGKKISWQTSVCCCCRRLSIFFLTTPTL